MTRPRRQQQIPLLSLLPLLPLGINAQSFVGGDLNAIAPFSLPPSTFSSLTSNANSDRQFPITGYNLTSPAGPSDATGKTVSGWALSIHLTADVPLEESTANTVSKDQFFQATRISLLPPDGAYAKFNKDDWMICGIVFTAGLTNQGDGKSVNGDGTCGGYISDSCIEAIQIAGVSARNGTAGQTVPGQGAGRCQDLELPDACKGDNNDDGSSSSDGGFDGHGGGSAFEIVPITSDETSTGNMAFFAAGSSPVKNKDDTGSIKAAEQFVWPVLLTWTHFGQGSNGTESTAHDSVGWLSCVQAPNTTSEAVDNSGDGDSGKDSGAGERLLGRKGFTMWAGIVGVAVVGLAAVL